MLKVAFDASTLILLAKIELLHIAAGDMAVIVTDIVYRESTAAETMDARLIKNMKERGGIEVIRIAGYSAIMRDFRIAEGEASTMTLAIRRKVPVATDDRRTIRACRILGLRFATAIHFVIRLYDKGKISEIIAGEMINKLRKYGWYHERIIEEALKRVKGV